MYKYYHEPNIVQLTKETSKAKLNTILDTTEILDYNKINKYNMDNVADDRVLYEKKSKVVKTESRRCFLCRNIRSYTITRKS